VVSWNYVVGTADSWTKGDYGMAASISGATAETMSFEIAYTYLDTDHVEAYWMLDFSGSCDTTVNDGAANTCTTNYALTNDEYDTLMELSDELEKEYKDAYPDEYDAAVEQMDKDKDVPNGNDWLKGTQVYAQYFDNTNTYYDLLSNMNAADTSVTGITSTWSISGCDNITVGGARESLFSKITSVLALVSTLF
jgi:hypothetical protein